MDAGQIEIGNAGSIPACSTNYMRGGFSLAKKTIPKKWLDRAIAETKEYYSNPTDCLALDRLCAAAREIETTTGIAWYSLSDFLSGILCSVGCGPSASNEDIYVILRLLGWEVSD